MACVLLLVGIIELHTHVHTYIHTPQFLFDWDVILLDMWGEPSVTNSCLLHTYVCMYMYSQSNLQPLQRTSKNTTQTPPSEPQG